MRNDEGALAVAQTSRHHHQHSDVAPPPNVRALLRVGNEYFLRTLDRLAVMHGDIVSALVFNAIWTANVKHITNSGANSNFGSMDDIPPDSVRRPISVLALSSSLRIPYETVRRYVQDLLKQGLCVRLGGKGILVPAAVLGRPLFRHAILEEVPNFLRFLSDIKRCGFDFSPYRQAHINTIALPADGSPPVNVRALVRVSLEFIMRGIDTLGRIHEDDLLKGFVFTAIWTANVRHIAAGAENLKYGALDALPPDEMRRPVTVTAVAGSLRMPYETVRRNTLKLIRQGGAVRVDGKGVIIPRDRLDVPAQIEGIRESHANFVRMIADLHRAGFDFRNY